MSDGVVECHPRLFFRQDRLLPKSSVLTVSREDRLLPKTSVLTVSWEDRLFRFSGLLKVELGNSEVRRKRPYRRIDFISTNRLNIDESTFSHNIDKIDESTLESTKFEVLTKKRKTGIQDFPKILDWSLETVSASVQTFLNSFVSQVVCAEWLWKCCSVAYTVSMFWTVFEQMFSGRYYLSRSHSHFSKQEEVRTRVSVLSFCWRQLSYSSSFTLASFDMSKRKRLQKFL